MANYDFRALNDKDLEELCRDLLNEKEKGSKIRFQNFKRGKDKGIDLRYSTNTYDNQIIVQVKHYVESGKEKLIDDLEKRELPKVKLLNPSRYIVATSVGLLPQDKERIKKIFTPYIQNTEDVLGSDDLNSLLVSYPKIQEETPKLWFTNALILSRILNAGIIGRSKFRREDIQRRLGLYVQTNSVVEAWNKLVNHKFVIITGLPGVGKTTLAEMVILNSFKEEFELVAIQDNLSEIESTWDSDRKQLFYFDDFLGSNYLEILQSRKNDSAIVGLIDRLQRSKNKLLILTTRVSILNTAVAQSEVFRNNGIELGKYQLEMTGYSQYEKAKILYNHFYFNEIGTEFKTQVFEKKRYWDIIKHKYYNPRVIEFITNPKQLKLFSVTPGSYFEFIKNHLDDPSLIWRHAYEQQLSDNDRFFLLTLFSLGERVSGSILRHAFESRLNYECAHHGYQREPNAFSNAEKKLADGFISVVYDQRSGEYSYGFVNPSVRDFFLIQLKGSLEERISIIKSAKYVEQILDSFPPAIFKSVFSLAELEETNQFIVKNIDLFHARFNVDANGGDKSNYTLFKRCTLLMQYCPEESGQLSGFSMLKKIRIESLTKHYDTVIDLLEWIGGCDAGREWIIENWSQIVLSVVSIIPDADSTYAYRILDLFTNFDKDYSEFINDPNNEAYIEEQVYMLCEVFERDVYNDEKDQFMYDHQLVAAREHVQFRIEELLTLLLPENTFDYDFAYLEGDFEELFNENQERSDAAEARAMDRDDYSDYDDYGSSVDDLFDIL